MPERDSAPLRATDESEVAAPTVTSRTHAGSAAALVVDRILAEGSSRGTASPSGRDEGQGSGAPITVAAPLVPGAHDRVTMPEGEKPYVNAPIRGVAFAKGASDAHAVAPADVRQGELDDCWFMSAMMSVARTSPEQIAHLVTERADGCYDVTLYIDADPGARTTSGRGEVKLVPKKIVVDSTFPRRPGLLEDSTPVFAKPGRNRVGGTFGGLVGAKPELWPMLLERALAIHLGSYTAVANPEVGQAGRHHHDYEGLELLTGKPSRDVKFSSSSKPEEVVSALASLVAAKLPVTMGTRNVPATSDEALRRFEKRKLSEGHQYSLAAVDAAKATIDLDNPYGHSHVKALPIADAIEFFTGFSTQQ